MGKKHKAKNLLISLDHGKRWKGDKMGEGRQKGPDFIVK